MFQYALGRRLSIIRGRKLLLDLSAYGEGSRFNRFVKRRYELGHFQIQAGLACREDLYPFEKFLKQNLSSRILRRISAFGKYYKRVYIFEPPKNYFIFDSRVLSAELKSAVYLDGFWQSPKYFENIEKVIREDFAFKEPPDEKNQQMVNEISACQSVAIHIRHGDNATKIAAKHGVLPMEYYQKAIQNLAQKVSSPHFFIFSDDPVWAKDNLKLNYQKTFISHNNEEKVYEDLRLMATCKHHIIGNSTFSWWGAWLGKKSGQLVYAPKRYFMSASPPQDLYLSEWKLIEI